MRGQVLSLILVIAGTLFVPLGLRAVNGALPAAAVRESYLPTVETPRPREPFDQSTADDVREVQPEFAVIGDSMAGIRIDPRRLSGLSRKRVIGLYQQGSPVAYWYLAFKNLLIENGLSGFRGAIFFFRDDQLTTQVQVTPGVLDRVAKELEPQLDRVLAANRLGAFSEVHRLARRVYAYDRTRLWLEPWLTRTPAFDRELPARINTAVFALDKLRKFEASDLAQAESKSLDFGANVDGSLLPEFIQLAERAHIRLAFIRVQRRPSPEGPPPQSEALKRYVSELRHYLETHGEYFYDDWGDADEPLSEYADGDHLTGEARIRYTERFAAKHARFLQ